MKGIEEERNFDVLEEEKKKDEKDANFKDAGKRKKESEENSDKE